MLITRNRTWDSASKSTRQKSTADLPAGEDDVKQLVLELGLDVGKVESLHQPDRADDHPGERW